MVEPGYEIGRDESGLTAREREVLSWLEKGLSRREVAEKIGVTKQRVTQIVRALRKKGALNG